MGRHWLCVGTDYPGISIITAHRRGYVNKIYSHPCDTRQQAAERCHDGLHQQMYRGPVAGMFTEYDAAMVSLEYPLPVEYIHHSHTMASHTPGIAFLDFCFRRCVAQIVYARYHQRPGHKIHFPGCGRE